MIYLLTALAAAALFVATRAALTPTRQPVRVKVEKNPRKDT